jgi:hypothetical protein
VFQSIEGIAFLLAREAPVITDPPAMSGVCATDGPVERVLTVSGDPAPPTADGREKTRWETGMKEASSMVFLLVF